MHMADAMVAPAVAGTMYACSVAAAGYSVRKIRLKGESKKVAVMGVMGAFVFAAQMINFTIPGTGSSGHLCGGMLLSAVLGPEAGFLTMIGVLLIQCLMFADGGLLALGCNIWNMAFYGCFLGAMVIWKHIMKNGMSKRKIIAASLLGGVITLQFGAFSVALETLASGVTELPFGAFVAVMQPVHMAIGFVEGLITASVLVFLYEVRPALLWGYQNTTEEKNGKVRLSYKGTIAVLAVTAMVMGGLFSLMASANPDGLEWSVEKITGSAELTAQGSTYSNAQKIQKKTALLPNYSWENSDSYIGTTFSGLIGGAAVIVVCVVCCYFLRFIKKRKIKNE